MLSLYVFKTLLSRRPIIYERGQRPHTTFFLSSDEEGLRSLCSEGDLGGLRPGDPREDGGLVEGFGEGSGPNSMAKQKKIEHLK